MKFYCFLLLYVLSVGQLACQSGDTYCVDVDYFNPKTGTASSYRLDAIVDSEVLKRLNFPSGGYLDHTDFGDVLFKNGAAVAVIKGGKSYRVKILKKGPHCFDGIARTKQCFGRTKHRERCKNETDNKSGLCWRHSKL